MRERSPPRVGVEAPLLARAHRSPAAGHGRVVVAGSDLGHTGVEPGAVQGRTPGSRPVLADPPPTRIRDEERTDAKTLLERISQRGAEPFVPLRREAADVEHDQRPAVHPPPELGRNHLEELEHGPHEESAPGLGREIGAFAPGLRAADVVQERARVVEHPEPHGRLVHRRQRTDHRSEPLAREGEVGSLVGARRPPVDRQRDVDPAALHRPELRRVPLRVEVADALGLFEVVLVPFASRRAWLVEVLARPAIPVKVVGRDDPLALRTERGGEREAEDQPFEPEHEHPPSRTMIRPLGTRSAAATTAAAPSQGSRARARRRP